MSILNQNNYTNCLLEAMQELEDLAMDLGGTTRLLAIETDFKEAVHHAIENNEQLFITDTMLTLSNDAHVQLAVDMKAELYNCLNKLSEIYNTTPEGLAGEN